MAAQWDVAFKCSADLGEGPAWLADHQRLLWVDIDKGHLHLYNPATGTDQLVDVSRLGRVGCAVPTTDGRVLCAADHGLVLVRVPWSGANTASGDELLWHPGPEALGGRLRFNDGKCDPAGRLLVGTMDTDEKQALGVLYSVEHQGAARQPRVRTLLRDITVANGLAWSPDHRTLYYIDSPRRRVERYAYDVATGELGPHPLGPLLVDTAAQLPEALPDGMAADADGHVWVAFWGGSCVRRYDGRSGQLLRELRLPTANTTSVAFADRALYITSSAAHLPAADRPAQPLAGSLFVLRDAGTSAPPATAFVVRS